jgi:NAD-dependent dihydropyrimidine dehydrogenase PreA subunit
VPLRRSAFLRRMRAALVSKPQHNYIYGGSVVKVTIDYGKCTNDLECVSACPMEVIIKKDDKAFVSAPENCIDCQACMSVCPAEAVVVEQD